MKLNCKPGDLAVMVRCNNPINLGRIVRCESFDGAVNVHGPAGRIYPGAWRISPALPAWSGWSGPATTTHAPDEFLRPIRGQDGEDQILRLVGKPEKVTA